ncbi:MAG: DUF2182 domain-containing protein [Nitrospirales bacterium]|nr:DUF2182 domain-containing protein [Nitrospirales bacterium]
MSFSRDQLIVSGALAGVTGLAWSYLLWMSDAMAGMGATGGISAITPYAWSLVDSLFLCLMWAVMMVGMMLPSAAPMTLLYAGMVRKAEQQGTPMPPTAAFVVGYLVVWSLFSLGATVIQWTLHEAALLSPMMVSQSSVLGGGLFILAGLYQLTPWKSVCLDHCRSPAHFFSQHWRHGKLGAFRMGLHHGAFCLGCCWALMGLLFVGGVMNLLWIAGMTIFVFLEKVLPVQVFGSRWRWMSGAGLILSGVVVFLT